MHATSHIKEPIDNGFNLGDLKTTEFSNPMYETIKTTETSTTSEKDDPTKIYEIPDKQQPNDSKQTEKSDKKFFSSLSSIIGRTNVQIRQGSLNPTSVDTGKDTQQLVEEDKSEC